ncbi:MAG: ATP-binding protein [Acholeplasmatales bacterium]|jgi:ATP-dependent DNA helicase RecG|nr:ATP-binding protein [Acholeplasmatales bacterium]
MNLGFENEITEFRESTAELDKALRDIAAILNKHKHGILYFGVKNKGDVNGQIIGEKTLRDISTKIYERIRPIPALSINAFPIKQLIIYTGNI